MSSSSVPNSQSNIRRSSRPSPARKQSHLIDSPADSRRAIRRRDEDSESDASVIRVTTTTSAKRKRKEVPTDDPDHSSSEQRQPEPAKKPRKSISALKKKSKQPDQPTQTTDNDASSQVGISLEVNLRQDSDEENNKVSAKKPKTGPRYDPIRDYYHGIIEIVNRKGEPGTANPCKWCGADVACAPSSSTNLLAHRDGLTQDGKSGKPGCQKRSKAIDNGCKLPLTVFEKRSQQENTTGGQTSITSFTQSVPKFDNQTLNHLLGMWVIRTAQPWRRMEDAYLRAAFRYANPNAQMFGRSWVSKFAHEAYLDMRSSVIDELNPLTAPLA